MHLPDGKGNTYLAIRVPHPTYEGPKDEETINQLAKLIKLKEQQDEDKRLLNSNINAILRSCATVSQLKRGYPEFETFAPDEENKTYPVVPAQVSQKLTEYGLYEPKEGKKDET